MKEEKKYKLIIDPKKQGCENCVVYKMFGESIEGEDCKQFAKSRGLDYCEEDNEIYIGDN